MRNVWAVARNTIAQIIRMKIALLVILLLAVLLPTMSVIMTGDGTLKGKLQTFTSYGLSLMSLMLSLLTVVISTFVLTSEIKRKHLHLVLSKPIWRYQVVLGKVLGVLVVNFVLLVVFGAVIYGLTLYMARTSDVDTDEHRAVRREFLTARVKLRDSVDKREAAKRAQQLFDELVRKDEIPVGMSPRRVLQTLRSQELARMQSIPVGARKIWEFDNVQIADPNATLFVKFKLSAATPAPDGKAGGIWYVGDLRQERQGPGRAGTPIWPEARRDEVRTVREFEVPAQVVAEDGYLAVALYNDPRMNDTMLIADEMEVLYKAGTFTGNFIRAIGLIYLRTIFLAVLGVSFSTWLSFPVALFASAVFLFISILKGFIHEALDYFGGDFGAFFQRVVEFFMGAVRALLWLFPGFDGSASPSNFIVSAELVPMPLIGNILLYAIVIKAGVLLALGVLIFNRREIATIVV